MRWELRYLFLLAAAIVLSSCGVLRVRNSPVYYAGPPTVPGYEPKGTVEEVMYPCSVPGPTERRMIVYLPEGYYDSDKRYPVFYLLHGARGYETSWIRKGRMLQITDSLFAGGHAVPSIVVMPNVNQYDDDEDFENSRYKDAFESLFEIDGAVESAFKRDVVDFVDSHYRTIPDKSHRAVAGLSIGGLQSAFLSANFPDTFDYIGLFSPFVSMIPKPGKFNSFYMDLRHKLAKQFSAEPPQEYYIMTGRWDIFRVHIYHYCRYLEHHGFPFKFISTPGGHDWPNWRYFYTKMMETVFRN